VEFVTREEKEQLEGKLKELKDRRPEVTQRIAEARALGDLKENAEYHSAKDQQGLEEAEIKRLEKRLADVKVADDVDVPEEMVFLGSLVKLRDAETGEEDHYKLVGEASGSFDFDHVEVTTASPLGEVLLKARVGETVRADLPKGTKRFEIVEIVEE